MRIRFGISSILVLATLVAVGMFVLGERARYFREHVFVRVFATNSGIELSEFKYRYAIVTEKTGIDPDWSDWATYQTKRNEYLALKVPAHCRLMVEAQAPYFRNQFSSITESVLVHPNGKHQLSIGVIDWFRITGVVFDADTSMPIEGTTISLASIPNGITIDTALELLDWEVTTDSNGRFEFYSVNPDAELVASHPKYQHRFGKPSSKGEIDFRLKPGQLLRGQVNDQETGLPIADCLVEVQYTTGVPITDPDILAKLEPDDGTAAKLRGGDYVRRTTTNAQGSYELYIEPRAANTRIRFIKKGWDTSVRSALAVDSQPVNLWRIGLATTKELFTGKVVDPNGQPIPNFRLWTIRDERSDKKPFEVQLFDDPEGNFYIENFRQYIGYVIQADGYAWYQVGVFNQFLARKHSPWNSFQGPSRERELITLVRGESISGRVKATEKHTLPMDVYLTDLRTCSDLLQAGPTAMTKGAGQNAFVLPDIQSEPETHDFQHHLCPDRSGLFEFKNLANGTYALLVQYNQQTVAFRPVVIDGKSIELPDIELPPLGRIHGVLANLDNDPPATRDQNEFKDAFKIYQLVRAGDPWGKVFRTDYRCGFSVSDVFVGQMEIRRFNALRKSSFILIQAEPIGFDFSVRAGQDNFVDDDSVVIHEIHVNELPNHNFRISSARLHGEKDSAVRLRKSPTRTKDGLQKWEVCAAKGLPSGSYELELKDWGSSFSIDLEYHANLAPNVTTIGIHPLLIGSSLDGLTFGGVQATYHKNGKQIGLTHLSSTPFFTGPYTSNGQSPIMAYIVDGFGPCDVVLYDPHGGWAIEKNMSLGSELDLEEVELQPGGSLAVRVSLADLDLFPTELVLVHQETGARILQNLSFAYCSGSPAEIDHLMPGKWTLTLTGDYPHGGKSLSFEKEFEIQETERIDLCIPER